MNDNTKITLTVGQLRRLVQENESVFPICEGYEDGSEDIDWGTLIGIFTIEQTIVTEMGEIGKITTSHLYYVYIHPHEGSIPHFHVFDKDGMHRRQSTKKMTGFHTCVAIKCNKYFKHGPYTDNLDKDMMVALDNLMNEIRDSETSDPGMTNFQHTIREWNANNAQKGTPGWVDPNTEKPDYTRISGNLGK